ncbi:MAG: hypothetical protein HY815_01815, partial [Candidatus Riflebacteria bacterium]|nr:hypothetical protein [Candidatus Riflebacteria bacterium]
PLRKTIRRGGVVILGYQLIHEPEVVEALDRISRDGVGLMRSEGFGQVRICDPVHWERVPPLTEGR